MKLKLGIKVGVMLSTLVLGLVCFVGCNSEEATPPATPLRSRKTAKPTVPAAKPDDVKRGKGLSFGSYDWLSPVHAIERTSCIGDDQHCSGIPSGFLSSERKPLSFCPTAETYPDAASIRAWRAFTVHTCGAAACVRRSFASRVLRSGRIDGKLNLSAAPVTLLSLEGTSERKVAEAGDDAVVIGPKGLSSAAPNAVQPGSNRGPDGRSAPGAICDPGRRGGRAGLCGPGRAARADGAARLPACGCAIRTMPRTPFRPRSWSWSSRRARSGCGTRWALAASGGATASPPEPGRPRRGPRHEQRAAAARTGAGSRSGATGRTSRRSSTRRSSGCRSDTACRSCSATCRGSLTKRRHGTSAGRSERSRAGSRGHASCCGTD